MFDLPIPKRIARRQPMVTISGSFNRFLPQVRRAVEECWDDGALVLSPHQPTPYKEIVKGFILLEGDRHHSAQVRSVEDRHLACIARSDFLWVVCPDGYIGNATAMEIGYALAGDVPIYSLHRPGHFRIAEYVTVVPNLKIAVLNHRTRQF